MVEICVSVNQFQKRWCWQLSSLLDQVDFDVSKLLISVAHISGTGTPTTEAVIDEFRGLRFRSLPYAGHDEFQYRGYVRNRQVAESTGKWLLFTDADMVFPREWFSEFESLEASFATGKCLYTGRYSTTLTETDALLNNYQYPCRVKGAHRLSAELPSIRMPSVGAGFCQIIDGDSIRSTGYYVKPGTSKDWSWSKHSRCCSDVQFRRSVGRLEVPLRYLVHLQHRRDKEFGYHLLDQR